MKKKTWESWTVRDQWELANYFFSNVSKLQPGLLQQLKQEAMVRRRYYIEERDVQEEEGEGESAQAEATGICGGAPYIWWYSMNGLKLPSQLCISCAIVVLWGEWRRQTRRKHHPWCNPQLGVASEHCAQSSSYFNFDLVGPWLFKAHPMRLQLYVM